jgi:hypothetical protein
MSYTVSEILDQLDKCAEDMNFPMLDNGYTYPADVRLTAYRDAARWAIAIEDIGYFNRLPDHNGFVNILHLFGNCLSRPPGTANDDFVAIITPSATNMSIFDDEWDMKIVAESFSVKIQGQTVSVKINPEVLQAKNIPLMHPPTITSPDLLRFLVSDHRDAFLLPDEQLKRCIPADLPQFIRLDTWYHNDLIAGEMPSQIETFQMLAKALVSGNPSDYAPTLPPNTHWSNWLEGGTL